MISEKAVEAACTAYENGGPMEDAAMRAALSAALPVLFEGKREAIVRGLQATIGEPDLVKRADRIISIMGGGE